MKGLPLNERKCAQLRQKIEQEINEFLLILHGKTPELLKSWVKEQFWPRFREMMLQAEQTTISLRLYLDNIHCKDKDGKRFFDRGNAQDNLKKLKLVRKLQRNWRSYLQITTKKVRPKYPLQTSPENREIIISLY